VPQVHAGVFAFTAREVVLMGRTAHGGVFARPGARDHEIADAMLARLGVAHLSERPYTMISGGERQLVLIARALAQEPRFVILDEPTASLDFGNQGKVMRVVRALAGDGIGVAFTTHDPNQAERYATEVVMLRDGRLSPPMAPAQALAQAVLEDLYRAPVEVIADGRGRAFLPG
jgi:iron complex transport system ATP-binding protein